MNLHRRFVWVVYACQLIGMLTLAGWFVGALINAVHWWLVKSDPLLAAHVKWQMRTFLFGLLWCVLGYLSMNPLLRLSVLYVTGVWLAYRILRGMLQLRENLPASGR